MHLSKLFRALRWLALLFIMPFLASCGGGGSCNATGFAFGSVGGEICNNNQASVSTVISGVASSGAPIIGIVEITDKNGIIKGSFINDDGTYKVDVSGMTGPFIVKAHGTVAGVPVTYYSAGTQEDVGGTINVTPFTDLILSNIAGRSIDSYLSNTSNILLFASELTPLKIRQTQDALFLMLRPILEQIGVTETVDLIKTVFKVDYSGLNSLNYLVKVEYDPLTSIVVLRNLITQILLTSIDVTKPLSSATIPPASFTDISNSTIADLQAIASVMRQIENLFLGGLPTLEALASSGLFVSSEYFNNLDSNNKNFQEFANEITSDQDNIGLRFRDWSLISFIPGNEAKINFKIIYKNKTNEKMEPESLFFKKIGTSWRIVGAS